MATRRIGLMIGREPDLARALLSAWRETPGISGEGLVVGGAHDGLLASVDAIVDRVSQRVPFYRAFLRAAVLAGVNVINDPFVPHDAFFALSVAKRLGLGVPRTVLLPQHSYGSQVDPSTMLNNLEHPIRWHALLDYVGVPAVLRSAEEGEAPGTRVDDLPSLWAAFNHTGERLTMLQSEVSPGHVVRCLCVGERTFLRGQGEEERGVPREIETQALALGEALGLDVSETRFVWGKEGTQVTVAADPHPAIDRWRWGDRFELIARALAEHACTRARDPAKTRDRHGFSETL